MGKKLKQELARFLREDDGTEVVEWALVAGLIVVIAAGIFLVIGKNVNDIMGLVNDKLQSAGGTNATP